MLFDVLGLVDEATARSIAFAVHAADPHAKITANLARGRLLVDTEVDENTITMDTNIADDLGADSLDVVELVMSIEDAFGITIEDEKAAELTTVRQVVDYLEKNA